MKITQKQSPEKPLTFSQLMYRSVIFCAIILMLFFLFGQSNLKIADNYYFSQLQITNTYFYHGLIIFFIWFLYLIFVTKDNTPSRIWNVIKLRGTFSTPGIILIRWYVLFFLLFLLPMFISFNIIVYLNSVNDNVIYQGIADIRLIDRKNNYDKRFEKINVNYKTGQIELYGHKENTDVIINRKIAVTVYQGVFYKYMIVKK